MESGSRLGQYEIVERLGAGGMGEVWLAQDSRLGRRVAVKVLPAQMARDPERLARFEQEAKTLAALNHPHIAQVFGLESADSGPVIVMELVQGRDLSQLLAAGPLDMDDALAMAAQIAAALGAAHDAGIVHRDLKPANVLVRDDGTVKVLDFGLAKTGLAGSGPASGSGAADLTESPTMLSPAMTATGVILGTAAYMAPEQARGRPLDRRADVWAFGSVLYEMLVGKRPFGGGDVAETLAAIIKDPVDFDALPADTPASIRRLLHRCLRKNPAERLDSMAAARLEIEDASAGGDGDGAFSAAATATTATTAAPASRGGLPLLAAAATGLIAGALLWAALGPGGDSVPATPAADLVRRSEIPLPAGLPLNDGASLAISHDGRIVAVTAGRGEQSRLYLRRMDSLEMEEVPDTEGALNPFFSPDGAYVGFFAGGELRKLSLSSGGRDITVVCEASTPRAATWDDSGWIYFTYGESRLARARQEGGEPEDLAEVGSVYGLRALPGSRGILMTRHLLDSPSLRKDTATIDLLAVDEHTVTPVLSGGFNARYLESGHLVFARGNGLFAVPFDLDTLTASPPEVSVLTDLVTDSIWAMARYDVSRDGTLIYVRGVDSARTVPTWIDLSTGAQEQLPLPAEVYNNFDLSPDGTRLAIQQAGGAQDQVYVYDSRRGSFTRLTLEGANVYPVWSSDGREVFFASNRDGAGFRVYRKPVDGSAPATPVLSEDQSAVIGSSAHTPASITPDGQYLLLFAWSDSQGGDLWRMRTDGSADPEPVLTTPGNEIIPQVSPDGRWLAFITDRAGPYQVVVRPFPDIEQREWVVAEGFDPRWSPNGDAIYYRIRGGRLMRLPIGDGDDLSPGVAEQVLETDFHDAAGSSFVLSPDDARVLVNKPLTDADWAQRGLTMVTGWFTEVARATGGGAE